METKAPTAVRILIATGFAISCFGLLLFLWISFGGPVPLKAEGYKVTVPFTEASQLAQGADVRVSGVSVGTISRVERIPGGEAEATLELNSDFAPIPSDTRAILRQKTLLGETYVELTPGSEESEPLPENGAIPTAQVSDAVQLDEVFRTFDPKTQEAFRVWMQGQAGRLAGPRRRRVGGARLAGSVRRGGQPPPAASRHPGGGGDEARARRRRGVRRARPSAAVSSRA